MMNPTKTTQDITVTSHKATGTTAIQLVTTEISDSTTSGQETPAPSSRPEAIATKVLKIIEQYGLNYERTGSWEGFDTFFPIVLGQVSRGESVKMLLPGFPFKSPNSRDKVLSNLPDLGEELALKHLNGLCENIKTVYEHGAEVHITSDGLVYNDLLGVPDEDVWNFGEAVRQVTVEHDLRHLSFLRLWDLLGTPGTWSKEHYLANASNIRQELKERYGDPQFEADMASKSSSDMQMTHTKYLEFLKSDLLLNEKWLAQTPEEQAVTISDTAKAMMGRWKAFAAALEANRTDYVRLSIHDSGGKDKLSMALIPQKQRGALGATPWHSVVVAELDGSYRSVQRHTVDKAKYELVCRNGRPYFFRAKSDLFDWHTDGCDVSFEHLYPTGLVIRPTVNTLLKMTNVMNKVHALATTFSPIILRGFSGIAVEDHVANSPQACGQARLNGAINQEDETVVSAVAQSYQSFICVNTVLEGSAPKLFASSRLFFRYLPAPWSEESLEAVRTCIREDSRLVVRHPVTGEPCIRWQEANNEMKLSSQASLVDCMDEALIDLINVGVHDWRSCLRFSLEKDDLLVMDNIATMHLKDTLE